MALGAEQRQYMLDALRRSLAEFYKDTVPTLSEFTNRKRATFLAILEKERDAVGWREKITDKRNLLTAAKSASTSLANNYQAKVAEAKARHDKELAELRAKQQTELAALAGHYEPDKVTADQRQQDAQTAFDTVCRASYFAGLGAEDDGRHIGGYRQETLTIDNALKDVVDKFIGDHLMDDEDGKAVQRRIKEEGIVGDLAFIVKGIDDLRAKVLGFITIGKLPKITVEAWGIENGVDVLPPEE